jgi:hypothetical protein
VSLPVTSFVLKTKKVVLSTLKTVFDDDDDNNNNTALDWRCDDMNFRDLSVYCYAIDDCILYRRSESVFVPSLRLLVYVSGRRTTDGVSS